MHVSFSIFFDGTRNHKDEDRPSGAMSNIARLFESCEYEPLLGQFRLYIPGVGTPFPAIGEYEPHPTGAEKGSYGDRRLRYAFLYLVNRLTFLLSGKVVVNEVDDHTSAAVADASQVHAWRRHLQQLLANPIPGAPTITGITLDLFGFSRGATAARSFLNHLMEWAGKGQPNVCGIPLRVRFMGLFDTVASVEFADSFPLPFDGHMGWARPQYLLIPEFVEQCVHLVAGYEARNSFPLTTIGARREQAPQRLEIVYPGVHSDVGGGYAPVTQGKGTDLGGNRIRQQQGDMLSQIPLNDMYRRAHTAAVPLAGPDEISRGILKELFTISPELQRTFDAHQTTLHAHRGGTALMTLLHSHYLAYLGWRRDVLPRPRFIDQPFMQHCQRTEIQDHVNLDQANAELGVYIQPFLHRTRLRAMQERGRAPLPELFTRSNACMRLFERYWHTAPSPIAATDRLMAQYVHDSRAGFVLTDPQCDRDYRNMHAQLERIDARYQQQRARYHAKDLPAHERQRAAHPQRDIDYPLPPGDPLDTGDRRALQVFREGRRPIFSDAHTAASMDGEVNALDVLPSRREARWSYLRRRQVFLPVSTRYYVPQAGLKDHASKRLRHADGLS